MRFLMSVSVGFFISILLVGAVTYGVAIERTGDADAHIEAVARSITAVSFAVGFVFYLIARGRS